MGTQHLGHDGPGGLRAPDRKEIGVAPPQVKSHGTYKGMKRVRNARQGRKGRTR